MSVSLIPKPTQMNFPSMTSSWYMLIEETAKNLNAYIFMIKDGHQQTPLISFIFALSLPGVTVESNNLHSFI